MKLQYMSNSFSLDDLKPPITKRKLAQALGVSERSIFNYQIVAMTSVDDFLPDYPSIGGKYHTAAPMTQYQAYVISQIKAFLDYFPNVRILQDKLENDICIQKSWGKPAFLAKFPEYSDNSQSSLARP